jgi:diguanylate cyclase (GGDEF)-like protein
LDKDNHQSRFHKDSEDRGIRTADRDVIALGIATAAIIMFVGTGGTVLPQIMRSLSGYGIGPDKVLVNALLLNIALIIFGWRRYQQLSIEVQERRKAEEQARILAETDPLTGCLNRRSINDATNRLIAGSGGRGEVVAFMMIDLDNFKQINDFNGHSAGDLILQNCAQRLTALLPERSLVARLGGDEFACVTPFDKARYETVDQLAVAIVEAVSEPVAVNGVEVKVTASIGIARSDCCQSDGEPGEDGWNAAQALMHMADIAMYHAKKQGRNCYFWFEEPMEAELRFRNEIENGIRRGLPLSEFVPYYQEQIDLQTGELTGFEMLARWNSPTLGVVSPEVFIPVAEQIGAIGELSECVIAKALEDAKNWDASLTLAVNISPLQLRDPWFAQKLLKLLTEANFPPHRLEIEITESCLHENIGVARTLITSLQNQGIRVSLDDFGTGYSSIAQLRSLPFNRIKIDRSFVTNLVENKDSAAIVHAIALLGQGLGLPITAEGIETSDVLKELKQYGDIKGQGYLYGQPQPATAILSRLSELGMLGQQAESTEAEPASAAPNKPRRAGNA